MMNLDNYYLHATGGFWGTKNCKNRIIDILRDGKIKINNRTKNHKESPDNQICLCDTTKPVLYQNNGYQYLSAFEHFVLYCPSLVFKRDFDVIIPRYGDSEKIQGVADCYDEVRYDKNLSLEHLKFITFPLWLVDKEKALSDNNKLTYLEVFKENINIITHEFKTIPIKNIYTGKDITADDVDRQIKVFQKRLNNR